MTAYEVMLSESQERMLLVAEKGREDEVDARLREVGPARRGHRHGHRRQAAARLQRRTAGGGRAQRGADRRGARSTTGRGCEPQNPAADEDVLGARRRPPTSAAALLALLASPNIASKRWIYRQYDSTVRTNTLVGPGLGRGGRAREGHAKALAMSVDGNGRYCWLDPFEGARLAVAEACRNVAAAGARAHRRHQLPELRQPRAARDHGPARDAPSGASARPAARWACPSPAATSRSTTRPTARAIYPTPVIGVVGLLEDASRALAPSFVEEGDVVYLLGDTGDDLGGSEFLKVVHGRVAGRPPRLDLEAEKRLHALLAEGGGAAACCSPPTTSATAAWRWPSPSAASPARSRASAARFDLPGGLRADVLLFSESPSRMIVTTRDEPAHGASWRGATACPGRALGVVGGDRLSSSARAARPWSTCPCAALHEAWMSLEARLGARK